MTAPHALTPQQLADWIVERATDARGVAIERHPRSSADRNADEAAQLRLLAEVAAEVVRTYGTDARLVAAEAERDDHVAEIARLHAVVDQLEARRADDVRTEKRLRGQVRTLREQRDELRHKLFDQTLADSIARHRRMSGGVR